MKTIIQLCLVLILLVQSYCSLGQAAYVYSISVDTITYSGTKGFLTDFRDSLSCTHVRISGQRNISFRSFERYSFEDLNELTTSLGSDIVEFNRVYSSENINTEVPKNGGQDCPDAAMVCSNNSFSGNASGFGATQEINSTNNGCLSSENQSSWYYINVDTPGSLEMIISPDDPNDDYDFAVWGPFTSTTAAANCPPSTAPVRCSWSATSGDTGIGSYIGCVSWHWFWGYCTGTGLLTPTDLSENAGGDKWVAPLTVSSGEVYILLIDNYSTSTQPFDLTWNGTAGLDCTTVPLPVELISFEGHNKGVINELYWETASEKNNDYFILQFSSNGVDWEEVDQINGAGTTSNTQYYSATHRKFEIGINYYRLIQVDFDGTKKTHNIISIDNSSNKKLLKRINTMGQEVQQSYNGIVILYYSDGSIKKVLQ